MEIDLDSFIPGSSYFRWREALWCDLWLVHVFPTDEQYQNIIKTASKMDIIRNRIGAKPIKITSWLRPPEYNHLIGGAKESKHCVGLACDFQSYIMTPDEIRAVLLPELERLSLRMEDKPGSSWVHIDLANVPQGSNRYFKVG